jgi:hypothetical protein
MGDELDFPSNNVEKCGNVISQAPDKAAAVDAAETAIRDLVVRLLPNEERTEAFLRGEGCIADPGGSVWPPFAFPLDPELSAALEAMPEWLGAGQGLSPTEANSPAKGEMAVDRRGPTDAQDLSVAPLPWADSVLSRDWAGRGFSESAERALDIAGVAWGTEGRAVLAGRFWRALARGGAQAALYVLDSALAKAR